LFILRKLTTSAQPIFWRSSKNEKENQSSMFIF